MKKLLSLCIIASSALYGAEQMKNLTPEDVAELEFFSEWPMREAEEAALRSQDFLQVSNLQNADHLQTLDKIVPFHDADPNIEEKSPRNLSVRKHSIFKTLKSINDKAINALSKNNIEIFKEFGSLYLAIIDAKRQHLKEEVEKTKSEYYQKTKSLELSFLREDPSLQSFNFREFNEEELPENVITLFSTDDLMERASQAIAQKPHFQAALTENCTKTAAYQYGKTLNTFNTSLERSHKASLFAPFNNEQEFKAFLRCNEKNIQEAMYEEIQAYKTDGLSRISPDLFN